MLRRALAVVSLFVLLIIAAGCASPAPTPEPTATPSPAPTPTSTPTLTPTPQPTFTPTPRPTPTPTATPQPTATPTSTPRPTATPRPRPTSTPTATPRPTATPTPAATPTPTPIPPTPTPTPRPAEYTAGLGYASAEGLEKGDAETYASAFADAKALGLGNADARAYASGVVYHVAVAANSRLSEEDNQAALADYAAAFEEAVTGDSPLPLPDALGRASEAARRNGWWPFNDGADAPETSYAETYASAFGQADATGVAAHGYASLYGGYVHIGTSEGQEADLANAFVHGYEQSDLVDVQSRRNYALIYLRGYLIAMFRVTRGITEETDVGSWAVAYADSYEQGLSKAISNGWDNPGGSAHEYAAFFAYAKVDLGNPNPHLDADSYSRGLYYATKRGLTDDAHHSYSTDYYVAYYDRKNWGAWPGESAHAYALAYADAKRAGREEREASTYATAYEQAYTSQKKEGASDEDAHLYAAAFADAKLGS